MIFLPLCSSKISISKMRGGNFIINYLSYFWIDFQNSCAYHVANFLNFSKMSHLLQFAWIEAGKRANNQVGTVLLDTLYSNPYYPHKQSASVQCLLFQNIKSNGAHERRKVALKLHFRTFKFQITISHILG